MMRGRQKVPDGQYMICDEKISEKHLKKVSRGWDVKGFPKVSNSVVEWYDLLRLTISWLKFKLEGIKLIF